MLDPMDGNRLQASVLQTGTRPHGHLAACPTISFYTVVLRAQPEVSLYTGVCSILYWLVFKI